MVMFIQPRQSVELREQRLALSFNRRDAEFVAMSPVVLGVLLVAWWS
jgi:hypothetical protein